MTEASVIDDMGLDAPPGPVVPHRRVRLEQTDEAVEQRKAKVLQALARAPLKLPRQVPALPSSTPSEDAMALAFVEEHLERYRYVAKLNRWMRWDNVRWREDSTGKVYDAIRCLV